MFSFGKVYNSFSELPGMKGFTTNLRVENGSDGENYLNFLASTESHDMSDEEMDRLMSGRRKKRGDPDDTGIPSYEKRAKALRKAARAELSEPIEKVNPRELYYVGDRDTPLMAVIWDDENKDPFVRSGGVLRVFTKDGGSYGYDVPLDVLHEMLNADDITSFWSTRLAHDNANSVPSRFKHGNDYKGVAKQREADKKAAEEAAMWDEFRKSKAEAEGV